MSDLDLQLTRLLNRIAFIEVLIVGVVVLSIICVSFAIWVMMLVGQIPDRIWVSILLLGLVLIGCSIWRISLGSQIADLRRKIEMVSNNSYGTKDI